MCVRVCVMLCCVVCVCVCVCVCVRVFHPLRGARRPQVKVLKGLIFEGWNARTCSVAGSFFLLADLSEKVEFQRKRSSLLDRMFVLLGDLSTHVLRPALLTHFVPKLMPKGPQRFWRVSYVLEACQIMHRF